MVLQTVSDIRSKRGGRPYSVAVPDPNEESDAESKDGGSQPQSLENAEDKKTDERDLAAVGENGAHSPEDGYGDADKGGNADTYSEKDVPREGGES